MIHFADESLLHLGNKLNINQVIKIRMFDDSLWTPIHDDNNKARFLK